MTKTIHMMDTDFVMNYLMPNVDAQVEIMQMLNEFDDTFKASEVKKMWFSLICEETFEWWEEYLLEGVTDNLLKEYCDILYVTEGFARLSESNAVQIKHVDETHYHNLLTRMKGAADVSLNLWTTLEIMEGFTRVHQSNMSKLTKDGEVLRRGDGKVLKSDQYKPANLVDLVNAGQKVEEIRKELNA